MQAFYDELIEVECRTDGVYKVIMGGVVVMDEHKINFRNSRVAMQEAINRYELHRQWENEEALKDWWKSKLA